MRVLVLMWSNIGIELDVAAREGSDALGGVGFRRSQHCKYCTSTSQQNEASSFPGIREMLALVKEQCAKPG